MIEPTAAGFLKISSKIGATAALSHIAHLSKIGATTALGDTAHPSKIGATAALGHIADPSNLGATAALGDMHSTFRMGWTAPFLSNIFQIKDTIFQQPFYEMHSKVYAAWQHMIYVLEASYCLLSLTFPSITQPDF